MFCPKLHRHCPNPRAVEAFDYKSVQAWLKNNCWYGGKPVGECMATSFFIQAIFGWTARGGGYHVWNRKPGGQVLDLTVRQFGNKYKHSTRLVCPSTVFDVNGQANTYLEMDCGIVKASGGQCDALFTASVWIKQLKKELPMKGNFGLTRRALSIRVNRATRIHGRH